eukprot:3641015-Lingulodinium_polyedra.AAC.1
MAAKRARLPSTQTRAEHSIMAKAKTSGAQQQHKIRLLRTAKHKPSAQIPAEHVFGDADYCRA